jgi:hypothetical protein
MAKSMDNPDDLLRSQRADDQPVRLTATEARQGSWGRPVLYVLVIGLILAFLAWGAAEFFGASIAPPSESTQDKATQSTTTDPIDNEKTINNNQPAGQDTQPSPTIQDTTKL